MITLVGAENAFFTLPNALDHSQIDFALPECHMNNKCSTKLYTYIPHTPIGSQPVLCVISSTLLGSIQFQRSFTRKCRQKKLGEVIGPL